MLQMTCLYILRVPQNKSVSPLRGLICKSFHLANIYRAPTVCWVQKDVGATQEARKCRSSQLPSVSWQPDGNGGREEGGKATSKWRDHFFLSSTFSPPFFFFIHFLSLSLHLSCLSYSLLTRLLSVSSTKIKPPQSFRQTWELSLLLLPLNKLLMKVADPVAVQTLNA